MNPSNISIASYQVSPIALELLTKLTVLFDLLQKHTLPVKKSHAVSDIY